MSKKIKNKTTSFKSTQKDLKQKLNMFDRIPDKCLTCNKDFDKKDKQQVQTWFVVVKNAENSVKIYCPECWNKATQLVKEFYGEKDANSADI